MSEFVPNLQDYEINRIPRKRILSSSARIFIQDNNSNYIDLGDLDSFTPRWSSNVVKQWKPFGYTLTKTLIESKGWDISFDAGKINFNLSYLIALQEKTLNEEYNYPLFTIKYIIKYFDGSFEAYKFNNVVFLNYDFDIHENNQQIPERIIAFSPERVIDDSFETGYIELVKLNNSYNGIMDLIHKVNKS